MTAPIVDENPPPPPSTATVAMALPDEAIPEQPIRNAPTPPRQQPKRHKIKPSNQPPAAPAEEAANPLPTPGVSAIGQLSSGDPANYRAETANLIDATEHGLNNITRPLSDAEQKTAGQIREFLRQAKAALLTGDVDGAHTLASKASVLLKELVP